MVDGVLQLVRRDVDRDADAVLPELLDLWPSRPLNQDRFLARRKQRSRYREDIEDPLARIPSRITLKASASRPQGSTPSKRGARYREDIGIRSRGSLARITLQGVRFAAARLHTL